MNVVLVQHRNGERQKKYCFEIDDSLASLVSPGTEVVCETLRGRQIGTAVSEVMTGHKAMELLDTPGVTLPLKRIAAVTSVVDISDVLVPIQFELSNPSKVKIRERKQELKTCGYVRTKMIVKDGLLVDGYMAYLAAKELGMNKIHILVGE